MRDPARIEPFLEELAALWKQHPDWRFGQLVYNVLTQLARYHDNGMGYALHEVSDEEFSYRVKEMDK